MDLKNQLLPEWLRTAPSKLYPRQKKVDHYTQYKKLKDYLYDNVHRSVTIGANLASADLLLNDHGPDHIETVVNRATCLLDGASCTLTPYEVYILLCCIELHDVGNIYGREGHENKAKDIMLQAEGICGRDSIEAKTIRKIFETHGGKLMNGSKDKIGSLDLIETPYFGTIRPRLIASILRFADELADDKMRANTTLIDSPNFPKNSEIFHIYAHCIQSVEINHVEHFIKLEFQIPKKYLLRTFGKNGKNVYLINEMYDRLYKMHLERLYCMKFSRGQIDLERIRVHIEFYNEKLENVIPRIIFDIHEIGYPNLKTDLFEMCPDLILNGKRKDGKYFKTLLK